MQQQQHQFEAIITKRFEGYYFAKDVSGRTYGPFARDILLGSSQFYLNFALARAGIQPAVGMRVRGVMPAAGTNKASQWWLA